MKKDTAWSWSFGGTICQKEGDGSKGIWRKPRGSTQRAGWKEGFQLVVTGFKDPRIVVCYLFVTALVFPRVADMHSIAAECGLWDF